MLDLILHCETQPSPALPTHLLSVAMRALLTLSVLCLTSAELKKTSDYYTGAVLEYHPVDSDQFQTAPEVEHNRAMQ